VEKQVGEVDARRNLVRAPFNVIYTRDVLRGEVWKQERAHMAGDEINLRFRTRAKTARSVHRTGLITRNSQPEMYNAVRIAAS